MQYFSYDPKMYIYYFQIFIKIHFYSIQVDVFVDIHGKDSHEISLEAPVLATFHTPEVVTESTPDKALVYSMNLNGFFEAWQSYYINVEALDQCKAQSQPVLIMSNSWNDMETHLMNDV